MHTSKPIQIFKPGKQTAMSGEVIEFTQAMLDATAAAYDPALHEAPFVKGHPKTDDPAWGWAAGIISKPGMLLAMPRQVEPAFAEDVKAGRWKKRSASFYGPNHPSNPVPGVYYLKHIGFLGAVPPAVKGMPDPEFGEPEEGLLTFSEEIGAADFAEWDDVTNASLWRTLREWFIGKFGQEEADKIIPQYSVQQLEQSAQDELRESQQEDQAAGGLSPAFSQGDEMSAEEKARLAALEAENAANKAKLAEFAEADKKRATEVRHAEHLAFADQLVKDGKLLPASKDVTVATMDFMSAQDQAVDFGEGDAKKPLLDAYKASLQDSPKLVEFGEVGGNGGKKCDEDTVSFAAPPGFTVDQVSLALHQKATIYMREHKTSYDAAVSAVSTQG